MNYSESTEVHPVWQDVGDLLHRWGIRDFAASLLEALGPLTILGAQVAYVGQPFLASLINPDKYQEIVRLLEEPEQTKAFVIFLQEENPK